MPPVWQVRNFVTQQVEAVDLLSQHGRDLVVEVVQECTNGLGAVGLSELGGPSTCQVEDVEV